MSHTAFSMAFARAGLAVPAPTRPPVQLDDTIAHRGLDSQISEMLTFGWQHFGDDELAAVAGVLQADIDAIKREIADDPGTIDYRSEGWRRRAEDALRHKRRQLGALLNVLNVRRKDECRKITAERAAAKVARRADHAHGDKDRCKASSQPS